MVLAECAALFCAGSTVVHLVTLLIAGLRCRRCAAPPVPGTLPAISILRPVCGVDPYAQECLESTFRLDYPDYEVVFCAASEDDPAVRPVRTLIACNRQVGARLLIGQERLSGNPKLNNLIKGWDAARHRWIVMADSNVLMPPDYLQRLLARRRENTGAVCSMPIGSRPGNFWAELECAFLNTLQARFQYVAESLGQGFAQGKTMLFCRDLIENAGGIRRLAAETAEDAAMTKIVRAAGLHVHLVAGPFEQPLGRRRARDVWARQLRWARLRRVSFVWLFVPEALVGSVFPAVAFAVAARDYGVNALAAVVLLLAIWFGAEMALARCAGWRLSARLLPALLLRDLLWPALWVGAWLGDSFVWRGTAMVAERASPRAHGRWNGLLPNYLRRLVRQDA